MLSEINLLSRANSQSATLHQSLTAVAHTGRTTSSRGLYLSFAAASLQW